MAFDYTDMAVATPLVRAIARNEHEEVQEALDRGFSANLPDNRGWTPLHEASISDSRSNCLKVLLAHCTANVNTQTYQGETALFLACQNKCFKVVKLLLKNPKCNMNLANSEGILPLHVACSEKSFQIVKLLIQFGAKVNEQDFNGYAPLHEAVSRGNGLRDRQDQITYDICQFLLGHGANPDVMEYEGNLPFHFACQHGFFKTVNLLYSESKQRDLVNFCNSDGRSPLMQAVESQNLELVEMLLSHGANPDTIDHANITALHIAAHSSHFGIFSVIQKATSNQCVLKTCTFDEERDFERILLSKKINSVICFAIDTEDLQFLIKVLESNLDPAILNCPLIHTENLLKKSFTLHTPISFLLESKMYDLGAKTVEFLEALIDHGSPLKVTSKNVFVNYINPICAALVALNDCSLDVVLKCLKVLLQRGADPDEPHGRMPFAMEQACMRECSEAVLLLLQYSNVLEAEDVIRWIEQETSSNQEKIIEVLLPLAPYYIPSDNLLPDLTDSPRRKELLAPQVHSLASYCRTVIRRQLHEETKESPTLFQKQLSSLFIPRDMLRFLNYM